jgi:hypothetical protein
MKGQTAARRSTKLLGDANCNHLRNSSKLGLSSSRQQDHLKGHFFGVWGNYVVRGTGFLQFGLTIRHF